MNESFSEDEDQGPITGNPSQHILLFSRGKLEGSILCNALLGERMFRSTSGDPETRERANGNNTIVMTNMPLMVGQQNERDIVYRAKQYMGQASYTAVVIVLTVPERSTPEGQAYYRIIRNIIGKSLLHKNTILAFTNADQDQKQFRKYISDEVLSSKKRSFPTDDLGTLIKTVHNDQENMNYDHCLPLDEKVKSTYVDLLKKAGQYNDMYIATSTKNGSLKSNLMGVLIFILVGIIIKLSYASWTSSMTEWENEVSKLKTECETKVSKLETELEEKSIKIESLRKENDKQNTENEYCKINITELRKDKKELQTQLQNKDEETKKDKEKLKRYTEMFENIDRERKILETLDQQT